MEWRNRVSKFLVTGGAGFIGSHIVQRLVGLGERVRVIDDFSGGSMENIADVAGDLEIHEADIRDLDQVREAVDGIDFVLHHAALPSVAKSVDDPLTTHQTNITGTLNLLLASRDAGVQRMVYAASSSAYGTDPVSPKTESMRPMTISPYGLQKYVGEEYGRLFHDLYGLETVMLRYFNVFGPRQDPHSEYSAVIPKFICLMLDGRRPVIYGDGTQSRDFVYVEDVVQANLKAVDAAGVSGEVFNIACGSGVDLNELTGRLGEIMNLDIKPDYADPRPGDVLHSVADISKARRVLGYEPTVILEDGLRKTVDFFAP